MLNDAAAIRAVHFVVMDKFTQPTALECIIQPNNP